MLDNGKMEKWMEVVNYTTVIKNLDMMVNLRMDCFMEMELSMHNIKLRKERTKLMRSM
jgi:hypothetical protein